MRFCMNVSFFVLLIFSASAFCATKPLEIGEEEMPELSNQSSPFRGKINHPGYIGHTWVAYPHVENPASLDMDPQGLSLIHI